MGIHTYKIYTNFNKNVFGVCFKMNCKYYKTRTKKYKKYGYCIKYKKEVSLFCKGCEEIEYKEYKSINKRTTKQAKAEKDRFSLFTSDLNICIVCRKPKDHLHEVFFGSNRQVSMKYGLVIPVCFKCHRMIHNDSDLQDMWHIRGQELFEKVYPSLDFVSIFGKNYK